MYTMFKFWKNKKVILYKYKSLQLFTKKLSWDKQQKNINNKYWVSCKEIGQ